jgi:hypothetical protein
MKHEIWVDEGEIIARHFRISVIDTLVVNLKGAARSNPHCVFVRLSGHPRFMDWYDAAVDTTEKRWCHLWSMHWNKNLVVSGSKDGQLWIPCRKGKIEIVP